MAVLWWVIAAFVMGVVEAFSLTLFFGTLVVGALAGALAAGLGGGFEAQALTASAVSLVLLVVVRPLLLRRLRLEGRFLPSGTAAHVGRPARVLAPVTELGGRVKLAGEEWSARAERPGQAFAVGEAVLVVAIDGATAVVAPDPARTAPPPAPGAPTTQPPAAPPVAPSDPEPPR